MDRLTVLNSVDFELLEEIKRIREDLVLTEDFEETMVKTTELVRAIKYFCINLPPNVCREAVPIVIEIESHLHQRYNPRCQSNDNEEYKEFRNILAWVTRNMIRSIERVVKPMETTSDKKDVGGCIEDKNVNVSGEAIETITTSRREWCDEEDWPEETGSHEADDRNKENEQKQETERKKTMNKKINNLKLKEQDHDVKKNPKEQKQGNKGKKTKNQQKNKTKNQQGNETK